jgi:hypothetical protein
MNDPLRQFPAASNVIACMSAMPTPSASPRWICPSTIIGLIRTPQSSTAMNRRTTTDPVAGSTSVTHTYAPNGNVRFGGLYTADASRCPSTPSGRSSDECAARAISTIPAPAA